MAHNRNALVEVPNLATCRRCGDSQVAWLKSERTGKFYLVAANVLKDDTGVRFIAQKFNFHRCNAQ